MARLSLFEPPSRELVFVAMDGSVTRWSAPTHETCSPLSALHNDTQAGLDKKLYELYRDAQAEVALVLLLCNRVFCGVKFLLGERELPPEFTWRECLQLAREGQDMEMSVPLIVSCLTLSDSAVVAASMLFFVPLLPPLPSGYRGSENNHIWTDVARALERYANNGFDLKEKMLLSSSYSPVAEAHLSSEASWTLEEVFRVNMNRSEPRCKSIAAILQAEEGECSPHWHGDRDRWREALVIMTHTVGLLRSIVWDRQCSK